MERSVTTGMQPEDFFGRCPTCSVECQDDILKLISKFCQGIVVEEAVPSSDCPPSMAFATESKGGWPSFDVTGGSDANSILQITTKRETTPGDIRFGSSLPCSNRDGKHCDTYNNFYKQIGDFDGPGHGCGGEFSIGVHPSSLEPGRSLGTEYLGQYPHIEDPEKWSDRNTDHTDYWATGNESWTENISEKVSGCPEFAFISSMTTVETVDLYVKEERFVIFPVCGELRVEDSGDDYISVESGSQGSFGTSIMNDMEAVFILISSDCPDPYIAKSSEHPHMVGRAAVNAIVPDFESTTGYKKNPAYSDEREFDNVEQKKNLGMYKLTYATKIGSVYKTTIGGAHDGDHVYYTSVDPRLYQENLGATDIEITQNDLCPDPEYWQFPRDSQCCGRNNILTLPMKKYDLPDEYQYHRSPGHNPNPVTVTLKEFSVYDEFYGESIEYWAWEYEDEQQRPLFEQSACEQFGGCSPYMAQSHITKLYYCAYKPGDLADFTDGQKKYMYDSMEDVIAAKSLEVGRRKIVAENNKFYMSPDNALGGIGCSKSGFMAVASSTNTHIDKDWGMQYWNPSLEDGPAFSIDGSNLYNRDRTEAISLQDEVLQPVTPYTYRDFAGPLVGITFYQAEISYRDFAKKAELETDYELDFDKIYERSFGFSNTVIPDGYGTGGYGKKENLDTPEKAIMAFTEVAPRYGYYGPPRWGGAYLDRVGTYYRWTQDKYYYDLKQQAGRQHCNDQHPTFGVWPDHGRQIPKDPPDKQCCSDRVCNTTFGRQGLCDFNRCMWNYGELQDVTTPRWFTGGGGASGIEYLAVGRESCYSSLGFYTKQASYPPKFDEGQRVHSDGSIDMDDFSFATTQRDVYTEDPNNPDEFIPHHSGTPGWGYWKRYGKTEERDFLIDGALCLADEEETYDGLILFPASFGSGMEEEDMTGVPKLDPDYNYYVHRSKIYRKFERANTYNWPCGEGEDCSRSGASYGGGGTRDYDFHVCGEKFIGFGKKWPVRGYGYLENLRPDMPPYIGGLVLYACTQCFTARIKQEDGCGDVNLVLKRDPDTWWVDYVPGDMTICDNLWCKDGHSIAGEIHSPREKGFVWYSIEGQQSSWVGNCCGGEPPRTDIFGSEYDTDEFDWEEETNSIMGCKLIKVPKISSGITSSVGLGALSIKVSLK